MLKVEGRDRLFIISFARLSDGIAGSETESQAEGSEGSWAGGMPSECGLQVRGCTFHSLERQGLGFWRRLCILQRTLCDCFGSLLEPLAQEAGECPLRQAS